VGPNWTAGLRTAELLSIGTELTVGETRDTNAGDLARDLTRRGVVVRRISALPETSGGHCGVRGRQRGPGVSPVGWADAGRPHREAIAALLGDLGG
jgi:hypothetical protein